jgi:hypothetical protein
VVIEKGLKRRALKEGTKFGSARGRIFLLLPQLNLIEIIFRKDNPT